MDEFCGGKYWDWDITWNTTNPDFTPCFEKTALTWGPCSFLWVFAIIDILLSSHSLSRDIPKSPLNITKYGLTFVLLITETVFLSFIALSKDEEKYYTVDYTASLVRLLTYALYWGLLYHSTKKGVRTSGVHFIFWLLHGICEAIRFQTTFSAWKNEIETIELVDFVVQVISFPCILALLFLNCWADVRPNSEQESKISEKPCPEESASFLSQIFFHWFSSFAWKGYKKPLEYKDLWDLNKEDKTTTVVPLFDKYWDREQQKIEQKIKKTGPSNKALYTKVNDGINLSGIPQDKQDDTPTQCVSIVPALFGAFGTTFLIGSLLKLIPDCLAFVSPQILKLLITFTEGQEEIWKGIFYAVVLFITALISTILLAQYNYIMALTGMRIRISLISAIYRKALLLSNVAKRKSTIGEIVNLMSVDVQRIMDLIPYVNFVWSAPFQIGIAIYFLWGIVGPSALAGLALMLLLVPLNGFIASKTRKWQVIQMKKKDMRIKMMNEILSGIKVLKLYAWENSFEDQVMKIRKEEIALLKKAAYLQCVSSFLWNCSPFLVALFTFGTYVLVDPANVLDAQKAFVSLSLFNILSLPLNILPMIIAFLVQAIVSINRLNKYMNAEQIDPDSVSHDDKEACPILIENGTFAWEPETVTLRDVNLKIKEGSMVAIVGQVGAGKSSLLSAMLGELIKISGRVNTKGSIAYVSQQAWIQNATVRDNILFGKAFDPIKYDKIVASCDLLPDLEILPAKDKTEIGEKGINLSGGQKQRVSLARAAYNNAEVYLFDDPLSAVDSHVGKHIFDKVLGPKGLLKRKTRVLVTHGIAYLSQMDSIIVMKDGEISEMGTYRELLDRKGAFAEFLVQYVTEKDILELESPELIQDLEEVVGKIPRKNLRQNSETSTGEIESNGLRKKSLKREDSSEPKEKSIQENKINAKIIQVEKSETESVKLAVYKDYFKAAGFTLAFITVIMYFVIQVFNVASNLWLSEWSIQPPTVNGTQDIATRDLYLGVYAGLGFMQGIFVLAATLSMTLGTLRSASNLHNNMLRRILHAPMSFFETTPTGRIVNRFSKDIDTVDTTLPSNLRMWINCFLGVLGIIVVITYSTPIFVAVIIPIGILYYFVQGFYVATSRQLKRIESVSRSPIYSHFGETISGASTIRAYSEQKRFVLESDSRVEYNQISYFPAMVASRWIAIRLEIIGSIVIFFAALFAVLARNTLSSGLVGLSVSYALKITQSLTMLVRWTTEIETNIVAVERIKEYCEVEQEADWEVKGSKPPKSWPDKGEVRFEHYQTRYRPGLELVLRDVTCTINPGEKVGIVGRTGAGKSSLTLALFRLIEPATANGTIVIDGQNITRLGLHDLRGRITIIPQDPVLFSGTLRINLDPFEQNSDEKLWQALELAHLKSFVKSLSAGLNHEISEGGDNLSVGQRQLVCLARAVLRKTKILVLDEATAAVDLETDDLIQQTIRSEFKDSTVITIAHRLNTIMDSTRVMVLDNGEIKEFDTPQNLLNQENSVFKSMAKDAGLA